MFGPGNCSPETGQPAREKSTVNMDGHTLKVPILKIQIQSATGKALMISQKNPPF